MDKVLLNEIHAAYYQLELKQSEITHALSEKGFEPESGWYNGHYHRGDDGNWVREAYPIPVIRVKGICDIEIPFDAITASTKRKRDAALAYPFETLSGYEFEAYGVEDYLTDFYRAGQTMQELRENIRTSNEKEIAFSFLFSFDTAAERILELVTLLRREGFYY